MQVQVPRETGASDPPAVGPVVEAVRPVLERQDLLAERHQIDQVVALAGV